jgi:predicted lipoprotein with Yx(FWY)xxD motif
MSSLQNRIVLTLRNSGRTIEKTADEETLGMAIRGRYLVGVAVAVAFGVLTVGAAASPRALVTVNTVTNPTLGKILVSKGKTLYASSKACTGSCLSVWPRLVVTGKPIAGPGVTASKLGTIKRSNGQLQVTYAGKALFRYAGDTKAGEAKGQGKDGIWHAIAPSGTIVKQSASSSESSSSSSGSTGMSSSSGSGSSGSTSSGSSGSSSSGSTGSGSSSGGTTTTSPTGDCSTNPGGYGCM